VLSDDPIISKVVLRYKFWPKRQDYVPPIERVPLADELQPHVPRETKKLNLMHYVRMIPHFYTIIKGVAMSNWKTTVTGIVGALAVLVNSLTGVALPQDAIIAVTLFALGFFAKDGKSND
jgi:hypothetical protein